MLSPSLRWRRGLGGHFGPARAAGFVGADAAEHARREVWPQTLSLGCVQHGKNLLQGSGVIRASLTLLVDKR